MQHGALHTGRVSANQTHCENPVVFVQPTAVVDKFTSIFGSTRHAAVASFQKGGFSSVN